MSDVMEIEQIVETKPKKMPMSTSLDKESIREAYEDVRSDLSENDWCVFKYDGARIIHTASGTDFEDFKSLFTDSERAFGYLRVQMGDEMSKRRKFLLLTWIGPNVGVLQRAKMSTDKAVIKDVITNFAVELQAESQSELDENLFRDALNRAGGANYGTGVRN
uniref:Coactosin-like protein n=1 Tax=Phlebotomus kandelakii TaxID=1109342 RepID=A0A6B2E801_9DIPT